MKCRELPLLYYNTFIVMNNSWLNKLECLSLLVTSNLVLYLKARLRPLDTTHNVMLYFSVMPSVTILLLRSVLLCCYAAMVLWCYADMLLCSYAAMLLLCCSAAMLLCCYVAMLSIVRCTF
jgi:hypothetical protein